MHFFGFFLICSDCVFGNILDVFHEFLPAFCMQLVSPTTVAHLLIFNSFSHFNFLSKTFLFYSLVFMVLCSEEQVGSGLVNV